MSSALGAVLSAVGEVPATAFLVATSGGADSAVTAAVVVRVAPHRPIRLVYLDHGRPASPHLGEAAAKLGAHLDLPLLTVRLRIAPGSWETEARRARREALADLAHPEEVIVTGHHRDDVAETVLANLVRGTGILGLEGVRRRAGRYWRPLHQVDAAVVRAAADELGLPYLDDPDNFDLRYRRNVIRHEIIPSLAELNPRVTSALARTADSLAAVGATIDAQAGAVPIRHEGEAWLVPLPVLRTVPRAIAHRAVAMLVAAARPPYGPTHEETTRIWTVIEGQRAAAQLAGGLRVEVEGPMLVAYRPSAASPSGPVVLEVGTSTAFGRLVISAHHGAAPRPRSGVIALDLGAVGTSLAIRHAAPGDRIEAAGGSKSVRSTLAEAGVPRRLRPNWPVVSVGHRIAGVVGVRSASWAQAPRGSDAIVVVVEGMPR